MQLGDNIANFAGEMEHLYCTFFTHLYQDDSLQLGDNIANFAGEMEPDLLKAAGQKMASAAGKFTSGLTGDPLKVRKIYV